MQTITIIAIGVLVLNGLLLLGIFILILLGKPIRILTFNASGERENYSKKFTPHGYAPYLTERERKVREIKELEDGLFLKLFRALEGKFSK